MSNFLGSHHNKRTEEEYFIESKRFRAEVLMIEDL